MSLKGLGAVLYQESAEGLRPVAFASRKLSTSERNYPVHQLEFLSLKWAVVDKFHEYLYGARFTVRTDNNPLTYVLSTAKLSAVGHRWLAAISTYEFDIQYRPGRHNIDADLLSRNMPNVNGADEWVTIPQSGVKTLCQPGSQPAFPIGSPVYVTQLGASPHCVPSLYAFPTHLELKSLELLSRQNLRRAQEEDDAIGPAMQAINHGTWPDDKDSNPELLRLKRETGKLSMKDGLLHRFSKRSLGDEVCQLLLPRKFREIVMRAMHDDLGHFEQERTIELLRSRFFWPKMSVDVEEYINNCGKCISYKTPPQKASPLHQIISHGPMDLVCIDFLSMEPDSRGFGNVLVVTDHFTRYTQAFPTKSQKAQVVAKILMKEYFVNYGLPTRIHSHQGRDFESRLIRELLQLMEIRKSRTTPYHPQGDPQPERFNRTLLSMLGTLGHENNLESTKTTCHSRYVAKLKENLKQAYKLASDAADKRHQRNKRLYDQRVTFRALEIGDRVFLRNFGLRGKHKLESKWKQEPYVVMGKLPNLPVFKVKREDGSPGTKTIHRDHLLPIGQLVRMPPADPGKNLPVRPRTRAVTQNKRDIRSETPELSESSDSSSELEYCITSQREFAPIVSRPTSDDDVDSHLTPEEDCTGDEYPGRELDSESDENRDEECKESLTSEETSGLESESEPEKEETDVREDIVVEPRQKRSVKPTIRLTYDELGRSKDQPLTIVHRVINYNVASRAELALELKGWCRGEALDETRALMVISPDDVSVSDVEDTLQKVKSWGRVRVRGRIFSLQHNNYMVLCECKETVGGESVPSEIVPDTGGEPWPIIRADECTQKDVPGFNQKLAGLLQAEGKTLDDLRTFFLGEEPASNQTEAILRAVSDLLDKTSKPSSEHVSYRRLRFFSGTLPTPAGEEQFDHWLEQARVMVEECDCSFKEKKRRLMESLRGPALELVKAVRASNPDVSPEDCIEALEHAFGTAETGDDLYFAFRSLQQQAETVRGESVPSEIVPDTGGEPWPIIRADECTQKDVPGFNQKLAGLLQAEGKTLDDLRTFFLGEEPASNQTEAILRAVSDLLDKTSKPSSEHVSYRRLRFFSGTLPTPAGEEQFDHWLEQARVMVEECDCSFKEKKRRLMESLRGPALELVKAVRASNPDVSPEDCIEALEHAFGTAETGDDLYFAFRSLQQQAVTTIPPRETVSSEFDVNLMNFGDSPISEQWKNRLRRKLAQKSHVFSMHEWDVGLAKGVEHKIRLSDARPFRQRSRRLAPADIEDVRKHLQELLQAGIIAESRSPYASPIVVVRKKNGTVRMCIDYRLLNSRTIPDQYTTPCIEDALNVLSGSQWFSVLDLRSGYYQIAMSEEDKEKTAFICPLGFFQFERMPQGITGAPATFQRLMEKAVGGMNLLQVLVYLDDLIVFGKNLEEHEERLLKVLDRLGEVGLKLSVDKCQICLSKDSMELYYNKSKVIAVTGMGFPVGEVNNFVVGSTEGTVYAASWHGIKAGINRMFKGHQGPVTGISCHNAVGPIDFSNLFTTSSFDWTVKLWSTKTFTGVVTNMVRSREWSRKTREQVITLHRKGNGYKKIAKMLNIPRDTIGSIIRKFKAKGTVETLPGRGRKKMLTSTAVRYLKRRVEKSPCVTAEELRKDLSDVGTEVSAQTIRRTLRNEGLHARTPRRTPLLSPKNKKSRLQYAKSHVDKPQKFWDSVD
ncbi:hypothetical protein C0J50_8776 [Silurus asotus]|uniref:Gypsy retrotransposon integrase-like protein 1 n=1 Tax=Silurus asotus TaxID=30991 RepID=A0AAD5AG79_SILAS|nr:hypothetical protein C0J50_8776 [Silurus asotus]